MLSFHRSAIDLFEVVHTRMQHNKRLTWIYNNQKEIWWTSFFHTLTRSKSASDNHNGRHGSTATVVAKQSNSKMKRKKPSEITSGAITFMVFSSINGFGLPSILTDPSLKGAPDAISALLHLYHVYLTVRLDEWYKANYIVVEAVEVVRYVQCTM